MVLSNVVMIYIQIPEKHDALGFLALAKSGLPISCLAKNSYGVVKEHLTILRQKRIPFKRLAIRSIRLPRPSPPLNEKV